MAYSNANTAAAFNTLLNAVVLNFSQTITYNGNSIEAIVDNVSEIEKQVTFPNADLVCRIKKADVTAPANGDVVLFGGNTYKVGETIKNEVEYFDVILYLTSNKHARELKTWR